MNDQASISEEQIFAYIGRLAMENQMLRQQLALLQQQITQQTNGQQPEEKPKVAQKTRA